jgi:hypothetical protein
MDMLAYSRAMAAFCRQRADFEGENDAFWNSAAADLDSVVSHHVSALADSERSLSSDPMLSAA